MAISVNLTGAPFRLNAQEAGGQPSYMDALLRGFKGAQEAAETVYKPKQLAEALLGKKLSNKVLQEEINNSPLKRQLLQAQINKAKQGPALTGDAAFIEYLMKNKDRINSLNNEKTSSDEYQSFIPSISGGNENSNVTFGEPIAKPGMSLVDKILQHKIDKLSGEGSYQGPAREAIDLDRLAQQYGKDSETYQNAKLTYDLRRQQAEDLSKLRNRTFEGFKVGEKPITNDQGQVIGKTRNKTEKERDIDRGTVYFDTFYPIVNQGLNYYSGEGSIRKLEHDAANYKTDLEARKRFDQFRLAQSLQTITGVNEAARFGAGRTNQIFNRFYSSLSAFDVPKKIESLIKEYQIPSSSNIKTGIDFQKKLAEAKANYEKTARPTVDEYFEGYGPPALKTSDQKSAEVENNTEVENWDLDENGNALRIK